MKKRFLKTMVSALSIALVMGAFAGCAKSGDNNSAGNNTGSSNNTTTQKASGSITADGSTALQPLVQAVSQMFTDANPDALITVNPGGSGQGLKDAAAGTVQIGNSDVFAEEKLDQATAATLVDHKVCVVGFAAVVNSKVTVDNLTKQQLVDIFTGKIKNWKEVGGSDLPITLISRPDSSGTKATFKKYALDGAQEATGTALKEDSSGAVASAVKSTDGAISYLASSFLVSSANKEGLKVLKFEGKEMNKDNITTGAYPIWSYEHMYTKGEATGLTKIFLDYFKTPEVTKKISDMGYIPNSDMKVSR
ncbi:MAG: phosphate ABC transporter substrate-binding protein [Bacillota bacterium]|nr:phosphate ABC transporter substrate-binding protein [Bacillota bacterium]